MNGQENDILLFERIKAGDTKVFEYIYQCYFEMLCRFSYGFVSDQSTAEDLVSDVFLEFWNKREQIEIKSSLKAYLLIAVRNNTLTYLGKLKLERSRNAEFLYFSSLNQDVNVQLERFIQIEKMEDKLQVSIDQLPPQCRQIFNMSRYDQFSYKEIAEKLNLSVGTVKTQLARALKKIRSDFDGVKLILYMFFSIKE